MPISLQAAKERRATVDIYSRSARDGGLIERTGMGPGDLLVTYRVIPDEALDDDAALSKAMQDADDDPKRQMELYAGIVARNVVSWDLSEVEGGPVIPITVEALCQTKGLSDILPDVIEGIANHKRPNRPRAKK